MNLRLGRFGMQEAAAAAGLCLFSNAVFSVDGSLYAKGNVQWIVLPLAILLLLLFWDAALFFIERHGFSEDDMPSLSLRIVMLTAALYLIGGTAETLSPFLDALKTYVFSDTARSVTALYLLPCLLLPAWLGMEAVGRSSRLIVFLFVPVTLLVLALGTPSYHVSALYPLFGAGLTGMARQLIGTLFRCLPALVALLAVGRGTQSPAALKKAGRAALWIGGGLAVLSLLAVGLAYDYRTLGRLTLPVYELTMAPRPSYGLLRTDRLSLFIWLTGAACGASFLTYAASLLWCRCFGLQDIRPAAVLLSCGATVLAVAI